MWTMWIFAILVASACLGEVAANRVRYSDFPPLSTCLRLCGPTTALGPQAALGPHPAGAQEQPRVAPAAARYRSTMWVVPRDLNARG